jgi:hypothetical protein
MRKLIFPLSLTILALACTKEPEVPANRENLLRDGRWKIASSSTFTVKKPDGKDTSLRYLDYIDSCAQDDFLTFDSLNFGYLNLGDIRCDAGEGPRRPLMWRLYNNDNNLDLYNGINMIFGAVGTVRPYRFDTLVKSPLRLDTIIGRLDTIPGFIKNFIELDTIRDLYYSRYKVPGFDIYGGTITNFSESSFTLNFSVYSTRLDTTKKRSGFPNPEPVTVPDTVEYKINFTK